TGMAAECGSPRAANIVMVGVLARALGWPSHLVVRSLRELLPERVLETNLAAFRRGEEYLACSPATAGPGP
ncbi:MAG: 2-oxoacid:acceptor oxidoreductase family protein, partial [Syntrophomonadaceae bacterium]|nr:2-oxoacid:acceptor oxidoreductase family protein [Syntrophomonadaceae bacterium]